MLESNRIIVVIEIEDIKVFPVEIVILTSKWIHVSNTGATCCFKMDFIFIHSAIFPV